MPYVNLKTALSVDYEADESKAVTDRRCNGKAKGKLKLKFLIVTSGAVKFFTTLS
jgi:hypothetical protein